MAKPCGPHYRLIMTPKASSECKIISVLSKVNLGSYMMSSSAANTLHLPRDVCFSITSTWF